MDTSDNLDITFNSIIFYIKAILNGEINLNIIIYV